jgi:hypothetical protein
MSYLPTRIPLVKSLGKRLDQACAETLAAEEAGDTKSRYDYEDELTGELQHDSTACPWCRENFWRSQYFGMLRVLVLEHREQMLLWNEPDINLSETLLVAREARRVARANLFEAMYVKDVSVREFCDLEVEEERAESDYEILEQKYAEYRERLRERKMRTRRRVTSSGLVKISYNKFRKAGPRHDQA